MTFKYLRGDLFGGITAGIVALPLALAFGVASGAGAAAGLYGAIVIGFFGSLFGGTKQQISGPTGPMTVVAAAGLLALHGDIAAFMLCVVLAGVFQIVLGMAKVGRFVRFIPYPVISGFMSGIGIIIILLQLPPLLGLPSLSSPMASLVALLKEVGNLNPASLGLGLLTMAIVFLTPPKVTRTVPSPLIALLVGTVTVVVLNLPVATIGQIPNGFPMPSLPSINMDSLGNVLSIALALALLGTIDTLLTSIVADSLTKERHNSNKELIGQGIGNMLCGFVGGLPGAGATMRTVVNINAGGKTQASGIIHALLLLVIVLGLGPLAEKIPLPVLAGILVKVGVDILDYRMLKVIRRAPKSDIVVMVAVFGMTVFVDLIVAVGAGVTLASLLLTYRITKQTTVNIDEVDGLSGILAAENVLQQDTHFAVRVLTIRGPFFFGSAVAMQDTLSRLMGTRVVLINCLKVPFMDLSAVFALSELADKLQSSGIDVLLAIKPEHREQLLGVGVDQIIDQSRMYDNHALALEGARSLIQAK